MNSNMMSELADLPAAANAGGKAVVKTVDNQRWAIPFDEGNQNQGDAGFRGRAGSAYEGIADEQATPAYDHATSGGPNIGPTPAYGIAASASREGFVTCSAASAGRVHASATSATPAHDHAASGGPDNGPRLTYAIAATGGPDNDLGPAATSTCDLAGQRDLLAAHELASNTSV